MDEQQMRLTCLELAIRMGAANPVEKAEEFLAFAANPRAEEEAPIKAPDVSDTPNNRTALSLIKQVAFQHEIPMAAIMGRSRSAPTVAARHEAMGLIRQSMPYLSLTDMGRLFGKDHTTIIHALKKSGMLKPRLVA